MPDTTLTNTIAGANGLPTDLTASLGLDSFLAADIPLGGGTYATQGITLEQLRAALGLLGFSGDVLGTGDYGNIVLTIADGHVTLAKLANIPSGYLLGRAVPGTGTPGLVGAGPNIAIEGGVISAATPEGVAPAATMYIHDTFGGF